MLTPFQNRAARALADAPFFADFAAEDWRLPRRTAVRSGELLFEKGDPSRALFGLIGGKIKIFSAPRPGQEVSLELVAPGELLGALGLEDGAPRYASARALDHSELATIPRDRLENLLDARPGLRAGLGRVATQVAARLAQRAEDLAFLSIESRVEGALVDLAARFGERVEAGTRIQLRQQDLADVVGASRESVSRTLAAPGFSGRLALGRGSITLLR